MPLEAALKQEPTKELQSRQELQVLEATSVHTDVPFLGTSGQLDRKNHPPVPGSWSRQSRVPLSQPAGAPRKAQSQPWLRGRCGRQAEWQARCGHTLRVHTYNTRALHTCLHTHARVHVYLPAHACMCTTQGTRMCTHVCLPVHTCTCTRLPTCTLVHVYNTQAHTCVHMYAYLCTHTHICAHACVHVCTRVHGYLCACTCVYLPAHSYTHASVQHACTCIPAYTFLPAHSYTRTLVQHTCTHRHTCTHIPACTGRHLIPPPQLVAQVYRSQSRGQSTQLLENTREASSQEPQQRHEHLPGKEMPDDKRSTVEEGTEFC